MTAKARSDFVKIFENLWVRFAAFILLLIFTLYLLHYLRSILLPFLLALFIAYLFDPLLTKANKKLVPRSLLAGFIVILLIFLFLAILMLFIPKIFDEVVGFVKKLPDYTVQLQELIDPLIKKIKADYPVELQKLTATVSQEIENKIPDIAEGLTNVIANTFTSLLGFILGLLKLIIVPIFTFFLLKDMDKIKAAVKNYLPAKYKKQIIDFYTEMDTALGGYIRGQLIISLIAGTIYTVGFILIGVPYGFLLGILIGLVNFVPYLGLLLGVVPAFLLTYLEYMDFSKILLLLILYGAQQALDGFLITPNILGHTVGLHPVIILMSLMIFGKFFGILGILIAVPTTAVTMVFIKRGLKEYKQKQEKLASTKA